jgi:elongation factor 1 alpha-like protein
VGWSEDRFNEITDALGPFLVQSGFQPSKTSFIPVAGFLGVNLVNCAQPEAENLKRWYSGPTLVEALGTFDALQRTTPAHQHYR